MLFTLCHYLVSLNVDPILIDLFSKFRGGTKWFVGSTSGWSLMLLVLLILVVLLLVLLILVPQLLLLIKFLCMPIFGLPFFMNSIVPGLDRPMHGQGENILPTPPHPGKQPTDAEDCRLR